MEGRGWQGFLGPLRGPAGPDASWVLEWVFVISGTRPLSCISLTHNTGRPGEGSQHYTNSRLLQRLQAPRNYGRSTATLHLQLHMSFAAAVPCGKHGAARRPVGQLTAIAWRAKAAAAASSRDPRVAGLSHSTVTARPAPPAPYGTHPRTLTARRPPPLRLHRTPTTAPPTLLPHPQQLLPHRGIHTSAPGVSLHQQVVRRLSTPLPPLST